VNRDGTIRTEFQMEIPRTECPRLGGTLWGVASGVVSGRADPERAIGAFDATGAQPFDVTAAAIGQNVVGWSSWATGEMFRRWATERDLTQLLNTPAVCFDEFRAAVAPQFEPWGFAVESLELKFVLADDAVNALPEASRALLAPPDTGTKVLDHSFLGDIPSIKDPLSGHDINVRCSVEVSFEVDLAVARDALDMTGQMAPERLEREILGKCEEWFWFGVKQSFYDWIFDTSQPHRRFVRDYSLIHPQVVVLCGQGLGQVGAMVKTALVRYEALDQDSAWALTAPGISGSRPVASSTSPPAGGDAGAPQTSDGTPASGPERITPASPAHRPGSDQAMAATIAVKDMSELPMPDQATAAGDQPPPSIEEAVWRHQKRVMKSKPWLGRAETAGEILILLKQDGYNLEERKRIADVIGADSSSVVD
jgi:hypothetical protein